MNALRIIRERENAPVRNGAAHRYLGTNFTRFYNAVVPLKNGECRIDVYAVKTRDKRTGELAIKKVMKYYSNRDRYFVRDVLFNNYFHTYAINWCNESFGVKHQAVWTDVDAYIGVWGEETATFKHCIDLHGEWLNWFEGTKYERCGWCDNWHMSFIQYAKLWRDCQAVEFLAKADLWRLITPSFTKRLLKDRPLFNFFRSRIGEIKKPSCCGGFYAAYGISEILYAYNHHTTLEAAKDILNFKNDIRRYSQCIPKIVDREELRKYLKRNDISVFTYDRYCFKLNRLHIDIDTYGYMFPSHWTKTYDKVDERYEKLVAKERAIAEKKYKREKARQLREDKKRLAHWKLVCGYLDKLDGRKIGELTIIVPKTHEQLKAEGNAMHNCIGSYGERHDSGKALLLFFHKDGNPFMDVEINPQNFALIQARYFQNEDASTAHKTMVRKIANEIKHNYRKAA